MLSDDIKRRLEERVYLDEGTSTHMGSIWAQHKAAHDDIKNTASKLHTFLDVVAPGHGLDQDDTEHNPSAHSDITTAVSGHSMSKGERDEFRGHINALKDAHARKQAALDAHDDHPNFKQTVGGAIVHGVFGRSGTHSAAITDRQDASRDAMEKHSTLNPNSSAAHALRKKHGAEYDVSPQTTNTKAAPSTPKEDGLLARAAKGLGGAVLNAAKATMYNGDSSPTRRRTK